MRVSAILDFLEEKRILVRFKGDSETEVTGFSSLKEYVPGTMTWIKAKDTPHDGVEEIALVVMPDGVNIQAKAKIITDQPKMVFFEIIRGFFLAEESPVICADSVIETTDIGKDVSIGHHCYIAPNVHIGDRVIIKNNVQIDCPTIIGDDTQIASGVVIGTDGYGYYEDQEGLHQKVPHLGGVRIGSDVDIGANTCIDRGTMGDTCIGNHVKIDNLCHIAHNVQIKDNAMIIAMSMLGGSCVIKENAYIAPGCLIKNQITVGENSMVGMGAVVLHDVEPAAVMVGNPARVLRYDNK